MKSKTTALGSKTPSQKPTATRDAKRTRLKLLIAAREEFSRHGLSGARVGAIAKSAGVNKQLLYYYFGDKEKLYANVLEQAYEELRTAEQALNLDDLSPKEAIEKFIKFSFDFLVEHKYFVSLLNDENLHEAKHIKKSTRLPLLHDRLRSTIGGALERGLATGVFKRQVDPADLYISIASLCFFYHSNAHTMSAIFQRDLASDDEIAKRRTHIVEMVMGFLALESA